MKKQINKETHSSLSLSLMQSETEKHFVKQPATQSKSSNKDWNFNEKSLQEFPFLQQKTLLQLKLVNFQEYFIQELNDIYVDSERIDFEQAFEHKEFESNLLVQNNNNTVANLFLREKLFSIFQLTETQVSFTKFLDVISNFDEEI
jgi:hypothetical protein